MNSPERFLKNPERLLINPERLLINPERPWNSLELTRKKL
jgi:hypothetical protein